MIRRSPLRSLLLLSLPGLLLACGRAEVRLDSASGDPIQTVITRLEQGGVVVDPAGRRPDAVRTAHFCWRGHDRQGRSWQQSLGRQRPGPVGFTVQGAMSAQDKAKAECPWLYRVEFRKIPAPKGEQGVTIKLTPRWWRVTDGACAPHGDPLMGEFECTYRYEGALPPAEAEPFFADLID